MGRVKLLLAALGLLLCTDAALGCVCITPDVLEAVKSADAVFSGEAVSVTNGRVRFKVERIWKGISAAEVTLLNGGAIISQNKRTRVIKVVSSCDFDFEAGGKYLVYADRSGRYFDAWVCSRTTRLTHAEGDLKKLGEGTLPRNASSRPKTKASSRQH